MLLLKQGLFMRINFFNLHPIFLAIIAFALPTMIKTESCTSTAPFISEIEHYYVLNNPDESYIYCNKYHSKIADFIDKMSAFDQDPHSPICQLNHHIKEGFSIARKKEVIEALMRAEQIVMETHKVFNEAQKEQLQATLNSIIDTISNGELTINAQTLLSYLPTSQQTDDMENRARTEPVIFEENVIFEKPVEFAKKVKFDHKAKFQNRVKFHHKIKGDGDVRFKKNVRIDGTLSVADLVVTEMSVQEAIIGCDITIGCDINMNNSISPAIGNIYKNNSSFIHNFGADNTFVGINAGNFTMTGGDNTGLGISALASNTSGQFNTASGIASLASNQSGSVNTAYGASSLISNVTGGANTAIGFIAMASNNSGSGNVATGIAALVNNNSGDHNVAVGAGALGANTTGSGNVAVGQLGLDNSTGSNNIAIGTTAGTLLTSGDNNVYIAHQGTVTETGFIRIGTNLTQVAAYIQGIFGSSIGISGLPVEVDLTGKLGTTVSSDRFKENISSSEMDLESEKIYDLNPVTFSYKEDATSARYYGLIAEEVEQVFPSLVVYDNEGQPFAVRYQVLPMLLLNEVQKHQARIEELADRVARLENAAE